MANKRKRKTKAEKKREQQREELQWITIVILSAVLLVGLLKLGTVGTFLYNLLRYLFGKCFFIVLGLIMVHTFINIVNRHKGIDLKNPIPLILLSSVVMLLTAFLANKEAGMGALMIFVDHIADYFVAAPEIEVGGGIIGGLLYGCISYLVDRTGVIIVIVVMLIIVALMLVSLDVYKKAFFNVIDFFRFPEREEEEEEEEVEEKEPRNMWKMLDEAKEKHEAKKMANIQADTEPPEDPSLKMFEDEKEEVPPVKPHSVFITYREDGGKDEIPLTLPGETLTSSQTKSPFIHIDELQDSYEKPAPKPLEDTQDLSVLQDDDYVSGPEVVTYHEKPAAKEVTPQQNPVDKTIMTRRKSGPYRLPKITLLDPLPPKNNNGKNETAAREKSELLLNILASFDIESTLLDTHIGPSVTQFEIKPNATNVKVSKINGLTDNIKMQLAARDIRIEAPIPGRNAVGVEIPNEESTPVKMKELVGSDDVSPKDRNQPLLIFLGKDLLGKTVTCRLDKMPHMLIAGATGSGKSVCMNSIITSLLMRTKPDEVKMLLVDPKKVEFTPYKDIPHLIGPIINDPNQANTALKVIVQRMDERYNLFAAAGVRNIEGYNQKVIEQDGQPNPDGSPAPKKMPYIVVIIDELADLMLVAGKEVEGSIQRITQLARAAGIHLIVATQRPSTDVITGVIKANIPSRIAFSVSSGIDSRTILDRIGAERLLGNGDMLYMPIGQNAPTRVQGVFVTDAEVQRITDCVREMAIPMYDDAFVMLEGINDGSMGGNPMMSVNEDPMFEEVKEYVIEAQKASTSLLQRRFGIGYNRAARMIDALQEAGVIGPAQGSKPREVFIKPNGGEQ